MSQPFADKESLLVDVSGMRLDELMLSVDGPLLESLRRIANDSDTDPIAGFSQGIS